MLTESEKRLNRLKTARALIGFHEAAEAMFKVLQIEDIAELKVFLETEIIAMESERIKKENAAKHGEVWQKHQRN